MIVSPFSSTRNESFVFPDSNLAFVLPDLSTGYSANPAMSLVFERSIAVPGGTITATSAVVKFAGSGGVGLIGFSSSLHEKAKARKTVRSRLKVDFFIIGDVWFPTHRQNENRSSKILEEKSNF
ncbi:hypothetical protein [Algoriphagus jejuensis]|uniref:hypothetical protein n=1 Tax=Algoriphagus jejuensis TaxID=419934 RepID=UPI0031E0447A